MTEIQRLEKQRQADRRTALLGLHLAEQESEEISACLTDEELACLVEGRATPEEKKKFLAHLASCSACYRRWLELAELLREEETLQQEKKILPFLQPKHLAWTGSLLAAAASVVLFFNISRKAPGPVLHQQIKTGSEYNQVMTPLEGQSDKAASPGQTMSTRRDQSLSSAVDSVMTELEPPEAAPESVSEPAREKSRLGRTAVPQQAEQGVNSWKMISRKQDVTTAGSVQEQVDLVRPVDFKDWLDSVARGCRSGEDQASFWSARIREAQMIVDQGRPQDVEEIHTLLPLLQQLQNTPEKQRPICRRILRRIHPEEGAMNNK